ncbi:MAG: HEAT repeat domain-containing protein [Dehalococcoidia bacterium]|nr:HEAT repeat domain-containing protein [Dehalococcoidia bacterium]
MRLWGDALGNVGDEAGVPALAEALQDENAGVRWAAKEALKKIKSVAQPSGFGEHNLPFNHVTTS